MSIDPKGLHISAPFIKRPVATFLLSVAVILAGAMGYKLLPVSALPQVEFPVISVNAGLPGADPETMASAIATPLERQFSKIAGINQMTSSSSMGSASIAMQFDLNRDVNGAARDVQAAINAARSQLPANLPQNPTYRKSNPSDQPILQLSLTSETLNVPQLYDASDSILAQKIAQVSGVGNVFTGGSAKPAVRIEANPTQLSAYGVGLEALRSVVGQANVNVPKGYLMDDVSRWSISTTDQLYGSAAYAPLIIATDRGAVSTAAATSGVPASLASAVTNATSATTSTNTNKAAPEATGPAAAHGTVRIQDVADVIDSVENTQTGGTMNGKPAIQIQVFKTSTANVIETVDNVKALLPILKSSISPAINITVAVDRTTTIRASVQAVTRTLMLSVLLVIFVVFAFLREARSTFIPSVSVPLSLLGTCGIIYMMGYTLDNLSLMALTVVTCFVVDDAIVVLENITRHLESGLSPYEAAMVGSKEIGFTVVSMSISLIAVFIPLLLMGGIVGRLFREFAVTMASAILVSLAVSLTTTPMLAAKFLRAHDGRERGWFYRSGDKVLKGLASEYRRGLRWVLRHQGIMLTILLVTIALNVYLFTIVPKGFFPEQDNGRLNGQVRGQQDASFATMKRKTEQLAAIVEQDPSVAITTAFLGGGGPGGGGGFSGNIMVTLAPDDVRAKRGDTVNVIMNRLRAKTAGIPGAQFLPRSPQELNIGARGSATQYQYSLTSDNLTDLNAWAPRLMAAMTRLPALKDVATDQMDKGLRTQVVIDRDTASRLGVSPLTIDATLSDAFGQKQVSTTYRPLNQYHVVMEVAPKYQTDPDALKNIYVKSSSGIMVPLSAVTRLEEQRIPLAVNHQSQMPAATLSFNLTPGASLSEATQQIEEARLNIGMPSTIHGGFQGSAQAFQDSLASEPILILLALVTVYIVLGMLYESLIHPLTILSTLPPAGVGAFVALLLFKTDLSVIAMIGLVLLIGIVIKNAIIMIDFALVAERDQGKTPEEAIFQAAMLRFRPIMMTSMAAILGGLPLALGTSSGSELRRPLGITIVGGLMVSQAMTLFTTPVVYLFFDRLRGRLASLKGNKRVTTEHIPQTVAGD